MQKMIPKVLGHSFMRQEGDVEIGRFYKVVVTFEASYIIWILGSENKI